MVLVLGAYGISSISLCDTRICHHGCDGAVCGAAVCIGVGFGASELTSGGNGPLVGSGGDDSGLVASTAGCMNLLFFMYLAPELV